MGTDTQQEATEVRVVTGVFATYTDERGVVRTAHRGDEVRLTSSEAERLDSCGTVADLGHAETEADRQAKLTRYRAERGDAEAAAAVARAVAPTDPIVDVSTPQPHVSAPGLGGAPTGNLTTGDTGGPDTPAPAAPAGGTGGIVRADAPDVATATVGELAAWIREESPNAADTVLLAEGEQGLAEKVLAAEVEATGGDPRKTVEVPLVKIIDAEE